MLNNKIKQVFAFEDIEKAKIYKSDIDNISAKIKEYIKLLEEEYNLIDYPNTLVWTTSELATNVFSNVPIPAFTNERFICISPDVEEWKSIYEDIHKDVDSEIVVNYHNNITPSLILQLLGHEITHHSDLFLDDFDEEDMDSGIWFEEGMCEYLSRKYLLSDEEFEYVSKVEWNFIMYYRDKFSDNSIEDFGIDTYSEGLEKIMYYYYLSFHTVKKIVEEIGHGNPKVVFDLYRKWSEEGCVVPLSEYFNISI